MKLYLSSYRFGNQTDKLQAMLGAKRRTAIIANAKDGTTLDRRAMRLQEQFDESRQLGLEPSEVDLREYFGRPDELRARLSQYDFVWVLGGNAFILRKAFRQSGLDLFVGDMIRREDLVYGGFSAGVCVLGPTLHGIELVDDEHLAADGYQNETIWDGLGMVPYHIAPHYQSDHPESEAIDSVVAYWETENMPYKTLRDGEVIVVDEPTQL
jgi:dipeptidase E